VASNSRDEKITFRFEATGVEQIDKAGKAVEDLANSSSTLAPKAQAVLDQLNKLGSQTAAIDNFIALKAAAGETGAKLESAQQGLSALNKEFDRADTSSRSVSSAFAKAEAEVSSLATQHNRLTAQVATAGGALRTQGIDTDHLDQAHRTLAGSLASTVTQAGALEKQAKRTGDETKGSGEKAKEAETAFGFLKDKFAEIISIAAALEIALKGIEIGKESVTQAANLEAQLSRVKAAAQDAKGQFEGMEEAVEKAAIATNSTSQTAAVGLTALVNSGKSAKDAVDALVPTLQLAKIANIDVSQAADLVAKNLDAFNVPAKDAARIVDLLTAASHGSAAALQGISSAAAELAPDAKTLGIDIDHTVGILGLLSDKGINAGNSVRALRTIFQDLQNPTSTLRGELLKLGDGTGDFNTAIASLTSGTPRANQALLTISGSARSVVELLGQAGPDAIQKFTESLERQNGIAAKTVSILDDNLKGAYTAFSNSVERIESQLAKPVLGPFKDELEKLAKELTKFAESPDFKDIEEEIGQMAREGARAIDNFLHGINWATFLDDAKSSLSGVVEDLRNVADSASAIAKAVNTTADVIGVAYHGVAGSIDGVVGAAAAAEDKVFGLGQKLYDSVGAGDKFRTTMEGARAAAQSLADEALTNLDQHTTKLRKDLDDLTGSAESAAAGTAKHGQAAGEAAPKVTEHAKASGEAAKGTADLVAAVTQLPTLIVRASTAGDSLSESLRRASISATELKNSAGTVVTGSDAIREAMKQLGETSQQALRTAAEDAATLFATVDKYSAHTAEGLIDRQNAFTSYAEKALAAAAGLDEGTKASVRADLEAKAAALGLTDALKILEGQASQTGNALLDQGKQAEQAATRSRIAADQASAAHFNAGVQANIAGQKAAEATDKAEKGFTEWGDAADKAALDTAKVTANTSHANEAMDQLTGGIAKAREGFLAVSDAAAKAYDTVLKGAFDIGHSDDGAGFDRVARAMTTALTVVNARVAESRLELQDMVDDVNQIGAAGDNNFREFGNDAADAAERMRGFASQIAAGNYQVGLLGKQELGPLQQALEAAAARAQQLADKAKSASEQLASINDQLRDQIDANSGNKQAQEDRRYEKQIAQIKALAELAGQSAAQQTREALANAEKVHKDALDKIRQEAQARKNPDGTPDDSGNGSGSGSGSATAGASFGGVGGRAGASPLSVVNIHLGDLRATLHGDPAHIDTTREILEQILRAKGNSI
jgi:TP901 family phage tail tape measure protein